MTDLHKYTFCTSCKGKKRYWQNLAEGAGYVRKFLKCAECQGVGFLFKDGKALPPQAHTQPVIEDSLAKIVYSTPEVKETAITEAPARRRGRPPKALRWA